MKFDRVERQLVIEDPADSLRLMGELLLSVSAEVDEDTFDRLFNDVGLDENVGTRDGWTNYDMSMEYYPIRLSTESTRLLLAQIGISEDDIPDISIED